MEGGRDVEGEKGREREKKGRRTYLAVSEKLSLTKDKVSHRLLLRKGPYAPRAPGGCHPRCRRGRE